MEDDKLVDFFMNNDFDIHEPHQGHEDRFLRKLNQPKQQNKLPWKWLSIAASVLLLIGFSLGNVYKERQYDLADISPKMAETQDFFVATIAQELKEVERFRSLKTETIIEDALDEVEELEDEYKSFKKDLNTIGNQRRIIKNMIDNYQRRLDILEKLLLQLDKVNNPANQNIQINEIS